MKSKNEKRQNALNYWRRKYEDRWESMREGDWSNNSSPSWMDKLPPWALAAIALALIISLCSLAWWAFTEFVIWGKVMFL